MLSHSPIMAFCATNDAERALPFYRDVLGLTLREDTPFAMVFDAHGTMLRVQKTQGHKPAPHTVLGWEVESISDTVCALRDRGVCFERFAGMEQDELGVWSPPGPADAPRSKVAWFKDPDGNLLSLTQFG
jgi:catechol 2,3-dioxygenase-like lactoylglutathione lyase family enzyme